MGGRVTVRKAGRQGIVVVVVDEGVQYIVQRRTGGRINMKYSHIESLYLRGMRACVSCYYLKHQLTPGPLIVGVMTHR